MGYVEINPRLIDEASCEFEAMDDREFRATFEACLRTAKSGVWEGAGDCPWFISHFRYRPGTRHRKKNWDREALWTLHLGVCYLCNQPVNLQEFEIEHVVPLARGGEDEETNLNVAHKACNLRKGTALPSELEWYVAA